MRSTLKATASLCLLLMLWSGVAVATHQHATKTDSATCQICVVAHSTAPKAVAARPKPTFIRVAAYEPRTISLSRWLLAFPLNNRPPPEA